MNIANVKVLGLKTAAIAALGAAALTSPAQADDCFGGFGGGISFSYHSGFGNDGCFSVGYSSPVYVYASGPRHYHGHSHGSYYGGHNGGYHSHYYGGYRYYHNRSHNDHHHHYEYRRPSYRDYYRPSYRHDNRGYRDHYRRYDDCGYYSYGYGLDGYYVTSTDEGGTLRFRTDVYAGDPNLAGPESYKVAAAPRTDLERAADLDPQWAGGALAMLRKGEADEAIVALEQAAYPETFGVAPAPGVQNAVFDPAANPFEPEPDAFTAAINADQTVSDMGGTVSAPTGARAAAPAGNPEAIRMLGLAMIADGQIDEGAAKIAEAYTLNPALASTPIDERLFPTGARFDLRDLVRKVSIRANRTDAPEAWFTLGVLMQAEGRDSVALDMVLKASAAGLDQSVISPMADSLRRVVYGRG
jgi:hypothetical protein